MNPHTFPLEKIKENDDAQNIPVNGQFSTRHFYSLVHKAAETQDVSVPYFMVVNANDKYSVHWHTDITPICLYTYLGGTQVKTQLPEGTEPPNQILCKVNQQSYIWIFIYQRISSQAQFWSARGSLHQITRLFFMHQSTFLPCAAGSDLPGDKEHTSKNSHQS